MEAAAAAKHALQVVAAGGDAGQSSFSANSPPTTGGGFVALDVGELSSLAGDAGPPGTPIAPPRTPRVVRSLSRKGDKKPADANATAGGGRERPQLFVHVATGDLGDAPGSARLVVHTPLAGTPGSKSRRFGRRAAPWLDPRRVVFLFATLSSVGTLILLYFTLSMSRADSSSGGGGGSGGSDAR